jgi:outer membrane protein assembly factor BamB
VVVGGSVYAFDVRTGTVYAFAESCAAAGGRCRPTWTAATEPTRAPNQFVVNDVSWRLAVSGGVVLAIQKGDHDAIYAFDARTGTPLWYHSEPAFHSGAPFDTPVVEGGYVAADIRGGLEAFPVRCRTDGGECPAAWTFHAGSYVVAADGVFFTNGWSTASPTSGTVYALPADCASGGRPCRPLWTASDHGFGELAVGDGMLFATSIFGARLDAYSTSCGSGGSSCDATWTASSIGSPVWTPVVEAGVVYVASSDGGLRAFAPTCGSGGAACTPIWTASAGESAASPPTIEGTRLFTVTVDGRLSAFALSTPRASSPNAPSAHDAILSIAIAAMGVLLLLVGRLRRRRG